MLVFHPGRDRLTHYMLEDVPESAVASVAAFVSQLLCCDGTLVSDCLAIKTDEMIDAQFVNVGIVSDAPTGEIPAKISAVGTNSFS